MQTRLNSPITALTVVLLAAGPAAAGTSSGIPATTPPISEARPVEASPVEATGLVPEATVRISNPRPKVEEPFFVEVELRWAGGSDLLLPHPPRFELPGSWKAGAMAASTRMDDGWSVVLYRLDLTAFEPGTFLPEPVHLRWTSDDPTLPADLRIEVPEVTVGARPLSLVSPASPPSPASRPAVGVPAATPPIGAAILALLLAAGALLLRGIRSRLRAFSAESRDRRRSEQTHACQEELLHQAIRLREKGHSTEAVQVLGEVLRELDAEGPVTARRLEEIRYGGNPPRTEELEGLEGRVRRELETRAPKPERAGETPPRSGIAVPSAVQSMD